MSLSNKVKGKKSLSFKSLTEPMGVENVANLIKFAYFIDKLGLKE
jgi:hypothetical protein